MVLVSESGEMKWCTCSKYGAIFVTAVVITLFHLRDGDGLAVTQNWPEESAFQLSG